MEKKPKGCASCKKKKPITELPPVMEDHIPYIPTVEDMKLAYVELGNQSRDKREFVNQVYKFIFDEDFNFDCQSCVNVQARKFKNYLNDNLKLGIL
jgi:hypothetical protein